MLEYVTVNAAYLASILGGVIVSVMTSGDKIVSTLTLYRVCAGVFSALAFTEPVIDWLGRDPDLWRKGVAALLAISGFGLVRMLSDVKLGDLMEIITRIRGNKS